jgi:S1-C subfamily serine protease
MYKFAHLAKALGAAAALLLCSLVFGNLVPGNAAHATDVDYASVGWWQIRYREVDKTTAGCYAVAQFEDRTRVMLALIEGDAKKNWVLFLQNPAWNAWIEKQPQHKLFFKTAKIWHGAFFVIDQTQILSSGVTPDFMNSMADSPSLTIWDERRKMLASLNLKDSRAAIKAIEKCVREHPLKNAPVSEPESTISGTGFFVASNLLLTNTHVVKECGGAIQVRYPRGTSHTAIVSASDDAADLALLRTDMSGLSVVSFRTQPRLGETVATYGFPYSGLLSSSGNFTLGNVTSLSGLNDDSRLMQMSTPTQPGNSGGPLLDMAGNVVGVIVGQLDAGAVMQLGKSVPQNVNFAIQASVAVDFLAANGVVPKPDTAEAGKRRDLPPADVADMARKFTVQIYCKSGPRKTSEADGARVAVLSGGASGPITMAAPPRETAKIVRRVTGEAAPSLPRGPRHPLNEAEPTSR